MMLLITVIGALATIACPITLPIWVIVIVGFHRQGRKEFRAKYLRKHGTMPSFGTLDWWILHI